MSIQQYRNTINVSDSPIQLSIRAIRSVLLYCRDWSDKSMSRSQKEQSLIAGQALCDSIVLQMRDDLPEKEARLLLTIFSKTSMDLNECLTNPHKSLIENERALIRILDILEKNNSK